VIAGYEASASGGAHPRINGHVGPSAQSFTGFSIEPNGALGAYGAVGELSVHPSTGIVNAMGIGGAIHEIGHLFGLPDLYSHAPFSAALGRFSVMCFGSHNALAGEAPGASPSLLDPWSKIQLGFIEPYVIDASEHRVVDMYSIDALGTYGVIQVISDADPDQYFLIENRRLTGFDAPLRNSNTQNHGGVARGDGGILIYHIDERVIRDERTSGLRRRSDHVNSNAYHRGVDLEAMMTTASGDLNNFNFNPFFVKDGLQDTFNPTTTPNSNFHTKGLCNDHRNGPFDCHPQVVESGIYIQVNSHSGQVMEVEIGHLPATQSTVTFHLYTNHAAINNTFGTSATGTRPTGGGDVLVIEVPVEPGTARNTWSNQELLNAALDIGNIYGQSGVPGKALWGWFDGDTLDISGRVDTSSNLRRPTLQNTCQLDELLMRIEVGSAADIDSLFGTDRNLDVFAVWSLWGDVNDDGFVDASDLDLLRNYLLFGPIPNVDIPLNKRAADVDVDGGVTMEDMGLLRNYINFAHLGLDIVLGRRP
jgi:hypothetical protein